MFQILDNTLYTRNIKRAYRWGLQAAFLLLDTPMVLVFKGSDVNSEDSLASRQFSACLDHGVSVLRVDVLFLLVLSWNLVYAHIYKGRCSQNDLDCFMKS